MNQNENDDALKKHQSDVSSFYQIFYDSRDRMIAVGDSAIHYLLISNGGGIAGGLTYLASKPNEGEMLLKGAIVIFAFGLILVGCALWLMYNHFSKLTNALIKEILEKKSFSEIFGEHKKRSDVKVDFAKWPCILSFFCVVAGLIFLGIVFQCN